MWESWRQERKNREEEMGKEEEERGEMVKEIEKEIGEKMRKLASMPHRGGESRIEDWGVSPITEEIRIKPRKLGEDQLSDWKIREERILRERYKRGVRQEKRERSLNKSRKEKGRRKIEETKY